MSSTVRYRWMDLIRGIAILLVIIWHASAVPALFGAGMPDAVRSANMFFLPFRMPTLMFLSGLLLAASLRKPILVYYAGKISMIIWPYLIWVTFDRLLLGADHPWWHWRAWYATSYLWFLFFIGVYYFAAPLIAKIPSWVTLPVLAMISFALPDGTEKMITYFAVFFFGGHLIMQHPQWLDWLTRKKPFLIISAILAVGYGLVSANFGTSIAYRVETVPFSMAGILTSIALTRWITDVFQSTDRRRRATGWLTAIGRNSLVFYVSHFPIMVLCWLALDALGVDHLMIITLINLFSALTSGALLLRLRQVPPFGWLFTAPAPLTGWIGRLPFNRNRNEAQPVRTRQL